MATREKIKKEIEYLMVCFPNYNPVLEGEMNVVTVFIQKFGKYSDEVFHEAIEDCTNELGRKFAPSTGELMHIIHELPYKGLSPIERYEKERGLRPASEVIQEMGLNDVSEEEQRLRYLEQKRKKESENE